MLFLSWVTDLGDGIGIAIENIMRALFYTIDTVIYKLIINLYDIFLLLCNGRLLNSDVLNQLSVRVGTILGVIMMFMVTFSFIQLLINPDAMNDKEKGLGNIAKKVLLVIVMLGTYGYIFNLLTNIQVAVINSNAIANLFVPSQVNSDDFGGILSGGIFSSFYTSNVVENENELCTTEAFSNNLKNEIASPNRNFEYGKKCLYETGKDTDNRTIHIREFNWILCTLVGIAIAYFIFSYCISVGMRIVQLAVLQIIAPMPIVSYLSPKKDNMFSKWVKMYFTTYIDVFIRIAIINFVSYLIGVIMDNLNTGAGTFWESLGGETITSNFGLRTLITVIMVIALLSFAKKIPELLKELFPSSGAASLGFGINKEGSKALGLAAGVGAVVGMKGLNKAKELKDDIKEQGGVGNYIANKGDELNESLNNLETNAGNFAKGSWDERKKMLRGAGTNVMRGVGTGVRNARGAVTSMYQGGKAGLNAKNPVSAIVEGGRTATSATVTGNKYKGLDYISSLIKDENEVKNAQARYDAIVAGTRTDMTESKAKDLLDAAKAHAFETSDKVQAGIETVEKQTGFNFKNEDGKYNYKKYKDTKDAMEIKDAGNWNINK